MAQAKNRLGKRSNYGLFIDQYYNENILPLYQDGMKNVLEEYQELFSIDNAIKTLHYINDDGSYSFEDKLTNNDKEKLQKLFVLNNELIYTLFKLDIINFAESYKIIKKSSVNGRTKRVFVFTKKRKRIYNKCTNCGHNNIINTNLIMKDVHDEVITNYIAGNQIIFEGIGTVKLPKVQLSSKLSEMNLKIKKNNIFSFASLNNKYLTQYKNYLGNKLFVIKNEEDFKYMKNFDIKTYIKEAGIEDYFESIKMKIFIKNKMYQTAKNISLSYTYDNDLVAFMNIANDIFDIDNETFIEICRNTIYTTLSMYDVTEYLPKIINKLDNKILPIVTQLRTKENNNDF